MHFFGSCVIFWLHVVMLEVCYSDTSFIPKVCNFEGSYFRNEIGFVISEMT